MSIQILTKPAALTNNLFALSLGYPLPVEPILVPSLDYGFDFDDEELGKELLAPLPACFADQPSLDIGAEEFDSLFKWCIV
jgi:hypothetical protein